MVHVVCEEVMDEEMAEGDEEGVKEHTGTKKVAAKPRDQPLLDRKAKEKALAEGAGSPFTACLEISAYIPKKRSLLGTFCCSKGCAECMSPDSVPGAHSMCRLTMP